MKTMKITACVLLAAMLLSVMVSCAGGASIVGKWTATIEGDTGIFEFKGDGTGKMYNAGMEIDFTYKMDAEKILITMNVMGMESTQELTYEFKGSVLALTNNGETIEFTRA